VYSVEVAVAPGRDDAWRARDAADPDVFAVGVWITVRTTPLTPHPSDRC